VTLIPLPQSFCIMGEGKSVFMKYLILHLYVKNFIFYIHFVSHFSDPKLQIPHSLIPDMMSCEHYDI